jgi:hypothetical protein
VTAKTATPEGALDTSEALQMLLGKRVLVIASLTEPAFCMAFQEQVMEIEHSPHLEHAITLHFGGPKTVTVPLQGTAARIGSSTRHGRHARWIELQLCEGPKILFEELR